MGEWLVRSPRHRRGAAALSEAAAGLRFRIGLVLHPSEIPAIVSPGGPGRRRSVGCRAGRCAFSTAANQGMRIGMLKVVLRSALGLCAAVSLSFAVMAQELTIGLGANVTSIDPHFHNLSPNNNIAEHIFDRLVNTRREAADAAGPRHRMEGDRRHDVGIQAAPGREVPRRQRVHRRGRRLHDRRACRRCRTARRSFTASTPSRSMASGDRRPVHDPVQDRDAVSAAAERPVDDLHRLEEGRAAALDRGLQLRQGGDRHRPLQVRALRPTATASSSRATTTTGATSRTGRR